MMRTMAKLLIAVAVLGLAIGLGNNTQRAEGWSAGYNYTSVGGVKQYEERFHPQLARDVLAWLGEHGWSVGQPVDWDLVPWGAMCRDWDWSKTRWALSDCEPQINWDGGEDLLYHEGATDSGAEWWAVYRGRPAFESGDVDAAARYAGYALHYAQDYLNPAHLGGDWDAGVDPLKPHTQWELFDVNYLWKVSGLDLNGRCFQSAQDFQDTLWAKLALYRQRNQDDWPNAPAWWWLGWQAANGVSLDRRIESAIEMSADVSLDILVYVFDLEPPEGCPAVNPDDTDGDGIPNDSDDCPTLREDFEGFEDDDGCPEGGPQPPVDTTPPHVSGTATPPSNAFTWNNTDVTIHCECHDVGPVQSGIAFCTPDQVISTEGRDQARSCTAIDGAGNSSTITVGGIDIDKTPPVTTATLDPPAPNGKRGWYISDVTVCLAAVDPILGDGSPGSDVRETLYQVNDGSWKPYTGCFVVGTEGWDNVVEFYSTDYADNVEGTKGVHFKLDKTPPDISIGDGVLDGLHWDQVHLERGILTNSDTLALSGGTTDNLCLWEVRAVDLDSGQVLDSEQPVSILIFPPPTPASMDYRVDVPLHQGINNIDVVAEDCAGWEKHLPIQVVYVTPGPYDPRTKGFWYNAVKTGKYTDAEFETLLEYTNVASDVFGSASRNIYGPVTLANYRSILMPVTSAMEMLQKAQLLATWLNMVSGRVAVPTPADLTKVKGWAQVVDNTGGSPFTFALNVPMEAEEVDQTRMASRDVYEVAKNLLDAFNNRMIIP